MPKRRTLRRWSKRSGPFWGFVRTIRSRLINGKRAGPGIACGHSNGGVIRPRLCQFRKTTERHGAIRVLVRQRSLVVSPPMIHGTHVMCRVMDRRIGGTRDRMAHCAHPKRAHKNSEDQSKRDEARKSRASTSHKVKHTTACAIVHVANAAGVEPRKRLHHLEMRQSFPDAASESALVRPAGC